MGKGDTLLNAGIGAVVTIVLSFTGLSPVLGGGLAGYLQQESRRSGAKAGALSGVFSFIPFLLFGVFFFGIVLGDAMIDVPGGPVFFVFLLFMVPLFLLWNAGLGAVGGYTGRRKP